MKAGQFYDVMMEKKIAVRAYELWSAEAALFGSPQVDWYWAVEDEGREI